MTKKAERLAQRCVAGGMAAGILACKLDKIRHDLARSSWASGTLVWGDVSEAARQAKILRKSFAVKEEARAIELQLLQWEKEIRKMSRKPGIPYAPMSEEAVEALGRKLKAALAKGVEACGKARLPWELELLIPGARTSPAAALPAAPPASPTITGKYRRK